MEIEFNRRRLFLMVALIGIGWVVLIKGGHLDLQNPRINEEDWLVLAAGMFLIGAGVGLPFRRPILAGILVGIAFPIFAWAICILLYWAALIFGALFYDGESNAREVVRSGYQQIPEARQIDELIGEADHFISGPPNSEGRLEWCTDIYFAGRYELGMRVDVDVDFRNSKVSSIYGKPKFQLVEVQKVEILDGRAHVSYRGAGQREFGAAEWKKVVEANGDFSVIGIKLKLDSPVPNFDKYVGKLPHRRYGP